MEFVCKNQKSNDKGGINIVNNKVGQPNNFITFAIPFRESSLTQGADWF